MNEFDLPSKTITLTYSERVAVNFAIQDRIDNLADGGMQEEFVGELETLRKALKEMI